MLFRSSPSSTWATRRNGRDRELTQFNTDPNADYEWQLCPDGTRIAIAKSGEGQIHILSLRGQPEIEVKVNGWRSLENLNWSADGKGFFVASRTSDSSVMLYVDLRGNASILWMQKGTLGNESAGTVGIPSPDGRHLAMMGFTLSGNMWMMEDF